MPGRHWPNCAGLTDPLYAFVRRKGHSPHDAEDLTQAFFAQGAPFCFYNGNTFASIIALVIKRLNLPAEQAHVVRSLAGPLSPVWRQAKRSARFASFANRWIMRESSTQK